MVLTPGDRRADFRKHFGNYQFRPVTGSGADTLESWTSATTEKTAGDVLVRQHIRRDRVSAHDDHLGSRGDNNSAHNDHHGGRVRTKGTPNHSNQDALNRRYSPIRGITARPTSRARGTPMRNSCSSPLSHTKNRGVLRLRPNDFIRGTHLPERSPVRSPSYHRTPAQQREERKIRARPFLRESIQQSMFRCYPAGATEEVLESPIGGVTPDSARRTLLG
ncbi:hypothetical protein DFR70_109224 [Nocardia tenerifensis]|uniref:Uncharacterized protein n=1 Tax=Nocardia tenerifensis TaxID=228006 RepID=A0A318K9I5_9NOCA|nr:hypothetical protein DFR70_109224 [Nocardia tenerifensis]